MIITVSNMYMWIRVLTVVLDCLGKIASKAETQTQHYQAALHARAGTLSFYCCWTQEVLVLPPPIDGL